MKAKFLRLLILSSFVLVGCDNPFNKKSKTDSEQEETPTVQTPTGEENKTYKRKFSYKMEALLKGSEEPYRIYVDYDDAYFLKDAEVYDKDLSSLSFGMAISATYEEWALDFFEHCQFIDIHSHNLNEEPTAYTLGYTFAHKTIGDSELFAVAIRGHEYKQEWQNNFLIGEEGDHEGFLHRANDVYLLLNDYISEHHNNRTIKLWISGYSRAGGISDLLTSLIFKGNDINVTAKNMFVYTFEAPASLCEENAIKYKNVHNIINSADLITYIPPTQYGLYRDGEDVEIYDANVSSIVHAWDNDINIPVFTSTMGATNDIEFVQYVLSSIFDYDGDAGKTAKTRAEYVANYQSGLSYSIGLIFAMNPSTRTQMMNNLMTNYLVFLDLSGQSMANFLKTYLDMDHLSYNNSELVSACAVLVKAFGSIFSGLISLYMSDAGKNDMQRILNMHYPEVTYCLLNNYHSILA